MPWVTHRSCSSIYSARPPPRQSPLPRVLWCSPAHARYGNRPAYFFFMEDSGSLFLLDLEHLNFKVEPTVGRDTPRREPTGPCEEPANAQYHRARTHARTRN